MIPKIVTFQYKLWFYVSLEFYLVVVKLSSCCEWWCFLDLLSLFLHSICSNMIDLNLSKIYSSFLAGLNSTWLFFFLLAKLLLPRCTALGGHIKGSHFIGISGNDWSYSLDETHKLVFHVGDHYTRTLYLTYSMIPSGMFKHMSINIVYNVRRPTSCDFFFEFFVGISALEW